MGVPPKNTSKVSYRKFCNSKLSCLHTCTATGISLSEICGKIKNVCCERMRNLPLKNSLSNTENSTNITKDPLGLSRIYPLPEIALGAAFHCGKALTVFLFADGETSCFIIQCLVSSIIMKHNVTRAYPQVYPQGRRSKQFEKVWKETTFRGKNEALFFTSTKSIGFHTFASECPFQ